MTDHSDNNYSHEIELLEASRSLMKRVHLQLAGSQASSADQGADVASVAVDDDDDHYLLLLALLCCVVLAAGVELSQPP